MVTLEAHLVPLGPIASPLTIYTHTVSHTQSHAHRHTYTHSDDIPWMASNTVDIRAAVCMYTWWTSNPRPPHCGLGFTICQIVLGDQGWVTENVRCAIGCSACVLGKLSHVPFSK